MTNITPLRGQSRTLKIQQLNDAFRKSMSGGRIVLSHDVSQLEEAERMLIIKQVLLFNDFTEDNDPYQEHDFGSFKHKGKTVYFKIDYYARGSGYMEGSQDPSNAELTARVLTIMFASEY